MSSIPHQVSSEKKSRQHRHYQQMPQPGAQPTQPNPTKVDHFYGHESAAKLCARFITHLFACPEYPPSSNLSQAKLPHFIAYALHRTKLHTAVTFASLVLLQRLKARFPTARGSSGHRLFISAFMIASKVICDDTYSNKSWSIVAQGMFTLREINQMEREMCSYLDWELTVDNPILSDFEMLLKRDFSEDHGAYPTYALHTVSRRAARAEASSSATPIPEPNSTTSPIPSFGHQRNPSPVKPTAESPSRHLPPPSPVTPDTPSASYSKSTSPASSASPVTPISTEEFNPKIQALDSQLALVPNMQQSHPLKTKMFAFAVPASW